MRMILRRTDVLHHYNRLLVCLNSKLDDELKETHLVRIEKKHNNFLQCLEFFRKYKVGLK